VLQILRKICKTCARILLTDDEIAKYAKLYSGPRQLETIRRRELHKLVAGRTEKMRRCPHCDAYNGKVQKCGQLKLIHLMYASPDETEGLFEMAKLAPTCKDLPALLESTPPKVQEDMTPLVVQNLLRRVPDADCVLLDLAPGSRPESLLLTTILAPPVPIRPSIPAIDGSGTSNEDDLTMLVSAIVKFNSDLKLAIEDGHNSEAIIQMWEHVQLKCAQMINGDLIGSSQQAKQQSKPQRGLNQRLKGKTGRFRGNLSGKRVDFSGRTVISPDPNVAIDQVAVPRDVCMVLTFPERCTRHNIERLRGYIRNGMHKHPGANFVETTIPEKPGEMIRYSIMPHMRARRAADLKIGDVVERHLIDDDVVLFNRQPSLHKMSIMSHRVKVRPWRTFRFNESVCNPYNADFDGDEMNLHVPQTEEARAEATTLMGTKSNICTPRDGSPLIAAIQDFITGAFLLTQRDTFLTKSQASALVAYMQDARGRTSLPPPAIYKPTQLWTGKQIVTVMLSSLTSRDGSPVKINVEKETKASYNGKGEPVQTKTLCNNDGYLYIHNSYHVSGSLDKASIGEGNKDGLFYMVLKDYNEEMAAEVMLRVSKLTCYFLQARGFSLGLGDVFPSPSFNRAKAALMATGYAECERQIQRKTDGKMVPAPGSTVEMTLEGELTKVLSDIRTKGGEICLTELSRWHATVVMAKSGAKGNNNNMAQMIACVGQQTISGSRIPNGFEERALPHFARADPAPDAKGFIENSFFTGLTPYEFFFHMMAGREGLVDTAVKTAETGYLSRRLMKAMEDLGTDYDLSVHNASGTMIQFRYGDDGLDPAGMEGDGTKKGLDMPVNIGHLWSVILADTGSQADRPLHPYQILRKAEHVFGSEVFRELRLLQSSSSVAHAEGGGEHFFIGQLRKFVQRKCQQLAATRLLFGLPALLCGPADADGSGELESAVDTDGGSARFLGAVLSLGTDHHQPPTISLVGAGVDVAELGWRSKCVGCEQYLSELQVDTFLAKAASKYARASIEPGCAVGAVGAQSLGEPSTQMTLKTFHFAGISSMNITQGVPRIKEIINASKTISSPVIVAPLVDKTDRRAAEAAKGRAERCELGGLLCYIDEVYTDSEAGGAAFFAVLTDPLKAASPLTASVLNVGAA
jgi:DNA-directed RNA polymerase III subunit RPC1